MVLQVELQEPGKNSGGDLPRTKLDLRDQNALVASHRFPSRVHQRDSSKTLDTRSIHSLDVDYFVSKYAESIWPYLIPFAVSVFLITIVIPFMLILCCLSKNYSGRR